MDLDIELPSGYVLKYYLYRAAMAAGFTAPIWYLYILENGVSYGQLAIVDSIWWAGLLLFEIPTGYIGDRIGRRNSLLVASVMILLAQLAMVFSSSFVHFAFVFGFWALASTFRSGTGDAWLYDVLKDRMSEDEFASVRGRGNSVMLVVSGATAFAGGYIADVSMSYAYLATAAVTALSLPVLLSFPKSVQYKDDEDDEDDETFTVIDALPVIRERFSQPPLRSFVVYVGLFLGVYWGVNFFIQPISVDIIGLGVEKLGWMYAAFTGVAAAVSYKTGEIRELVGIRRWFLTVPFILGALYVAVAFFPLAAIPTFFAMRALKNVTMPFANQFINDHVASAGRATVLSTAGMVYHMTTIPFELMAGSLAEVLGPIQTIGLFGAILLVGATFILGVETPIPTSSGAADPTAD